MEEERDDLVNYMQELVDLIIVDLIMEDRQGVGYDKFWRMKITERGIKGQSDHQGSKNRRLYMKKVDH